MIHDRLDRAASPGFTGAEAASPWPGRSLRGEPRLALQLVGATGEAWIRTVMGGLFRRSRQRGDRGDVPGWVLVTLMTAGLVLVLWGIARERLTEVFNHAIDSVLSGH